MSDYSTLVISKDIHTSLKLYCEKNGLKINEFVNKIIREQVLFSDEKSVLPLILTDNKNQVFEKTTCTFLSSEFKNNMPKELTLLRTVKDGSGYIGNYILK